MASSDLAPEETNTVRFLLASDTHIGYLERDPVRGQDALHTFRELLRIAKDQQVDFILLGGDLFHDNKPSRPTMFKTMSLLREYTFGDDPVSMELLSDPYDDKRKDVSFPSINYDDANLNVSIPVFSIHGNHDDPQGLGEDGSLSALDVLAAAGLINYFGRMTLPATHHSRKRTAGGIPDDMLHVRPILLRKGDTRIALYGMGNMKDERMSHELREKHICMYRPSEDTEDWFNIMVLHQNRASHNPKAYVPESALDDSLHYVVWGHEHEQRISPEAVSEKNYYISQPGSTVVTSLSPGEVTQKCAAIVQVCGKDFKVEPIPLETVRPFVMKDINLTSEAATARIDPTDRISVTKLLRQHIEQLMEQAAVQWDERMQHHTPATRPPMPLPLIRLRVHYDTQIPLGNLARFGQEFVGRVANPKELLQLQLRRERQRRDNTARPSVVPWDQRMAPAEKLERVDLASLVMDHIRVQQFDLLNASQLQKSVIGYVEKEEREAIETFVNQTLQSVERQLSSRHMQESQIQEALEQLASHPIAMEAPSEAPSSQDSMYEEMRPSAPASPSPPPPPRRPTRGRTATQSAVPATPHTASRSAVLGSSSSTDVSTTSPSRPARRRRRVDSSF